MKEKRLTSVPTTGTNENAVIIYSPGTKVFFLHPTASWRLGEVVSASTKNVVVIDRSSNSEYTLRHGDVHVVIDNLQHQQEIDNLLHLSELHEATLLHNVQTRFSQDKIYTYTGPIVIALNPFQKMPHLYDEERIRQYRVQKHSELPPHIFAVADQAYQSMLSNQANQSILISGESGAGKTETTKLLMKYLAAVSGRNLNTENVQEQIMEANPILEAFGNAKTLRNNNSSRFGRWVSIQFDAKGCLTGAVILNYLLEKSRIVYQAKGERNYHIFYQLLAGAKSSGFAEKFQLTDIKKFNYLNQSGCTSIAGVNDAADFEALKNALSVMGILEEDQTSLFKAIAAVLHLGNVSFVLNEKNENWNAAVIENPAVLKFVASLLGVDARALEHSLVTRMNLIRGEYFEVPLDLEKARDARDSVAKAIYNEIFGWLVMRINEKIADYTSERFIGLLDIFGFESFAVNSFEQFCINLANEKLQQHYNRHTFKWEQEACYKEEIDYTKIEFVDNQQCLDLIEKKLGILALLDEESNFPKATDESFLAKLIQHHADNPNFSKTPKSTSAFSIKHYAAEVSYESVNFLEKNKDTLNEDILKLLTGSTDPFLRSLMTTKTNKDSKLKLKKMTVSASFKRQLDQLMEEIEKTAPHWIRCVKPNNEKQAQLFDGSIVLHQLRCAGVLETVRIRKSGYPIRMPLDDFAKRFSMLHPGKVKGKSGRATCDSIISQLKLTKADCQLGLTRVFLRQEQFDSLDKMRGEKLHKPVITIQRVVRGFLTRTNFKRGRAARKVQRAWRGYYYSTHYKKLRAATLMLQTSLRRFSCAKQFKTMKLQNKYTNGVTTPEAKPTNKIQRKDSSIYGLDLGNDVTLRALASIYDLESGLTLSKLENVEQGLLQALERVRELKEKAKKPGMTLRRKTAAVPVVPVSKPAPTRVFKPTPSPSPSSSPSPSPSPSPVTLSSSNSSLPITPGSPSMQRKSAAIPLKPAPTMKPSPFSVASPPTSPSLSPSLQRRSVVVPPVPATSPIVKKPFSINPSGKPPPINGGSPSQPPSSLPPAPPSSLPPSSVPPPGAPPPPPVSPRKPSKSSSFFSKFTGRSSTNKLTPTSPSSPSTSSIPSDPPPPYSSLAPPLGSKSTSSAATVAPVSIPTSSPNHPPGGFATRSRPAPARRNKNTTKAYQPPPGAMWSEEDSSTNTTPSSPSLSPSPSPSPIKTEATNSSPAPPSKLKPAPTTSKPTTSPLKSSANRFIQK